MTGYPTAKTNNVKHKLKTAPARTYSCILFQPMHQPTRPKSRKQAEKEETRNHSVYIWKTIRRAKAINIKTISKIVLRILDN